MNDHKFLHRSDSSEEYDGKCNVDNNPCSNLPTSSSSVQPVLPSFVASEEETQKYTVQPESSSSPLNALPPEILSHVFEYLPLKERKGVRLVCKSWMKCCTCPSITQNEIFVFRPGCEREDIIETLQKTNFSRLNLEFQISPLRYYPLTSTWETCGHRIQEIVFQNDCSPDDETLKNIILHCVNLTSLKLCKSWPSPKCLELLDYLIENNIKRTRLSTFVTFFPYHKIKRPIAWNVVKKLFLIFPCLKNFGIQFYDNREVDSIPEEVVPIELVHQLESLTVNIRSDICWLENPIIPVWELKRLTKFETSLTLGSNTMKKTILNFFSVQKYLKVISLTIWPRFRDENMDNDFAKTLIFHILENCPNLKEFSFAWNPEKCYEIDFTSEESIRFITQISNLQSFVVNLTFRADSPPSQFLKNLVLKPITLRLKDGLFVDTSPSFIFNCMFQCHSHVKHLELSGATDQHLQNIFEHLTDLESLVITSIGRDEGHAFIGEDASSEERFSIKRLQKLECLSIFVSSLSPMVNIIQELQLPHVKHCTLTGGSNFDADFGTIFLNMPALESLVAFTPPPVPKKDWENIIESCEHAKNLIYLCIYVKEGNSHTEFTVAPFFKACPTLRFLHLYPDGVLFSFNPLTEKISIELASEPTGYLILPRKVILHGELLSCTN